jgi:serine/threonine-protein kinase
MSSELMSQFLENLHASRLLDNERIDELLRRPEPPRGDLDGVASFLEKNGWLTRFQIDEIRNGRGSALMFSGYRLLERLPDPPGARAYKAFHPALKQAVVVRWIDVEWLGPADTPGDYVERARAASLVSHPNLVGTLDAGLDGATPFVVHEYVDGAGLDALVNEMGALPAPLACNYARQAALALQAGHERGVFHGNFSPACMIMAPVIRRAGVNGSGRAVSIRPAPGAVVKVAELGLIPLRPPAGDISFMQSHLLGAIDYLAPERLATPGRDAKGDLYSLGASLYFLMAARSPFAAASAVDAMLQLQQAEPTRIEALRHDVPQPLADLVHRLLAKDPAARPASAGEVAQALEPFSDLGASPAQAEPPFAVPIASETQTVPNALPGIMAQSAPLSLDDDPFHQPRVEPLPANTRDSAVFTPGAPKVEPLSDSDVFGRHTRDTGPPRKRVKKVKHGWTLLIFGIMLHVIAIGVFLYAFNIWPFEKSSSTPGDDTQNEKKEEPKKGKRR